MELWRKAWRDYLAPAIPLAGLEALQAALDVADERLMQGSCILEKPFVHWSDAVPDKACPLYFAVWQGYKLRDVESVASVAAVAFEADDPLEFALSPRATFMHWFDRGDFIDRCVELCEEVTVTIFNRLLQRERVI